MKIDITDLPENKAIALLADVIKIEQQNIDTISEKLLKLEGTVQSLTDEKSGLEETVKSLTDEKSGLEKTVKSLTDEKSGMEETVKSLTDEKSGLEETVKSLTDEKSGLEETVKSLTDEKSGLEGTVQSLTDEKSGLEETVQSLTDEKSGLEETVETLIKEKEQLRKELEIQKKELFCSKLSSISAILRQSSSTLEQKWQEFVNEILMGIDELTQSNEDLKDIVSKLHGKNGWLTKTSSLYWWGAESNIGKFIPSSFDAHSVFHDTIEGFIAYLGTLDFHIVLPQGDFSGKILNYKPDYDEETCWVKKLFPQYEPEGFVLCEISFLSINGNTGKCIGIR